MTIMKRGSTYHLRKRVPRRYEGVEERKSIWVSLHMDSLSVAQQKAPIAWQHIVEGWEARLAGDTSDAEKRFEAAKDLAAVRGFRYLPAPQIAKLPQDQLLARVEAVKERKDGELDMRDTAALMGGVSEPPITVTRALELHWGLVADKTLGKSPDQLRRWENPRKKAVKNFVDVVGDKAIGDITGDDMLDFRQWWFERIQSEDLTPNSGNKDLIHLGDVLKTVNRMKRLGLVLPLADLSFKEGEAQQRPPFSESWIRDKLLAPGALDGLNKEARCILLAMVNTGARPSELAALTSDQIGLGAATPHISIEPVGRRLKTRNARRVIPLTGVSLKAMAQCPDGFPKYRTSPASLSATVNKYLRANRLSETPGHSLYGLRHTRCRDGHADPGASAGGAGHSPVGGAEKDRIAHGQFAGGDFGHLEDAFRHQHQRIANGGVPRCNGEEIAEVDAIARAGGGHGGHPTVLDGCPLPHTLAYGVSYKGIEFITPSHSPGPAIRPLFDCDRFGQVAGLVDIGALGHRRVIGQKLHRQGI